MNIVQRILRRRTLERDLSDEIQQHLEERTDALVAAGVPRTEARLQAQREFGNVTLVEERGREVWRWGLLEDLWADMGYAARQLRHTKSFTVAAVITLAVGIGGNTAVFSLIRAMVLRPLPFPHPERLVAVEAREIRGGSHPDSISYPSFFDFRDAAVVPHLVCYRDAAFTLTGRGAAMYVTGQIVSWDLFQLLGVEPIVGRAFVRAEEQPGTRVAILSHALWTTHFGGDRAVAGRTITLNGQPFVVVGVAPEGFQFPLAGPQVQVWTTLAVDAESALGQPITRQRGARVLNVVARLAPGMTIDEAHARFDALAATMARRYPEQNGNQPGTYVQPLLEWVLGDARSALFGLWSAVGVVLLIACANLANMLLVRAVDRERELAVRLAIGGSRGRVIRQLVTEHLLLTAVGCTIGLVLAIASIHWLVPLVSTRVPRAGEAGVDGEVLVFMGLLAVTATLVSSVPAALRLRRVDLGGSLRRDSRGGTDTHDRLRGTLVVGQIAVSLALVALASILGVTFVRLIERDPGFDLRQLVSFGVTLPDAGYPEIRREQFVDAMVERVRSVPGVAAATAAMPLPLAGDQISIAFDIEQHPSPPQARPASDMAIVVPGYFSTIGAALVAGRDFGPEDDDRHPRVMIVNRAFADRFFPGQNAIGRRVETGATSSREIGEEGRHWREIVGIVGNVRQSVLARNDEPIYYLPYKQMTWSVPSFIVRATAGNGSLESDLRRVLASIDGGAAVHDVRPFSTEFAHAVAAPQFLVAVMGCFAVLAVVLAMTGLYGVLSYAVSRRTREIGVRMALGAAGTDVIQLIMGRAARLVLVGEGIGVVASFAAVRGVRSLVVTDAAGVSSVVALAAAVLALSAAAAAALPTMRAVRVSPTEALRVE